MSATSSRADADSGPWWKGAFGTAYLSAYAHRDDGSAEREAAFAARSMGLARGARVLDAGCGAGRHSSALAARGFDVVGLDLSADLLHAAANRGDSGATSPRWIRGDVRSLPFRTGSFDHAVSFFTSFGYFDDAGDRQHLAELRRVIRSGGAFLLDFLNAPRVVATLVTESRRAVGRSTVYEMRAVRDGRVEKRAEVIEDGAVVARWSESVRLYERSELETMMRSAGLPVREAFGDLDGAPWNLAAPRLVLLSEAA